MSTFAGLISTPTLIPSIIGSVVFGVELVCVGIRYAYSGTFEPYLYLIKLALVRTAGEIMRIVWTRTDNPSETFIIVAMVLSKIGSIFILLCLFRTLTYWIQFRVHPGRLLPPGEQKILRLSLLVAVGGQILGIVGIVEMFKPESYNLGITLRDVSRGLLLAASAIFILLVLANAPRARDSTNASILLLLGVIAAIRATYDVVAVIVPSTSPVANSELWQYAFDSLPEALGIGIPIFYNLARVKGEFLPNSGAVPLTDIYESNGQYSGPYDAPYHGQYQSPYPQYTGKASF